MKRFIILILIAAMLFALCACGESNKIEELEAFIAENPYSCEEGEVDNSVFDRYLVPLYKQASYKPYIIAAMIFLAQVKDPVKALMEMDESKDTRKVF